MKLGIMELNRPEDVEWNPKYPGGAVVHVAFTKSGRQTGLNQQGVLYNPEDHDDFSPKRIDAVGSIFSMREEDSSNPGASLWFDYWLTWLGTKGTGPYDAANPDNLMIDHDGGVNEDRVREGAPEGFEDIAWLLTP
jgi:secreted PhoX family phosphatase